MSMIKDYPDFEKPREKALRYGIRTLSNRELLAILLRSGPRGQSVLQTADLLLRKADGMKGIGRMSIAELCDIKGISRVKALEMQACFEIVRRSYYEDAQSEDVISCPDHMIRWLRSELGSEMQEKFMAVYLDAGNRIISSRILFTGTINEAKVYPREVFREALLAGCVSLILVHNHPSGILTPSMADIELTERLIHAGKLMGVKVLDHLIITGSGWLSMAGESMFRQTEDGKDD